MSYLRHRGPQWGIAIGFAAVGLLRLWQCGLTPANTGDAARLMLWGLAVLDHGPQAASQPLATWFASDFVPWAHLPYNYPPLSLALFSAVAGLSPTLLALKLTLTALDALSAWLVREVTGDWWLALLFWALPASVWWVSREGQFEGAQSTLILASLLLFRRLPEGRRWIALVTLALAVQIKLTAIVMLPLLLSRARDRGEFARLVVAHAAGYAPTAIALLWWPAATNTWLFSASLRFNPYHWNVVSAEMFTWTPLWMIIPHHVVSWGLLIALVWVGVRSRCVCEALPTLLFLVFLKTTTNGQFWYTLSLAPLLVTLSDRRMRWVLIAATPLLDLWSLTQIFTGPTFFEQPLPDGFTVLSDVRSLAEGGP